MHDWPTKSFVQLKNQLQVKSHQEPSPEVNHGRQIILGRPGSPSRTPEPQMDYQMGSNHFCFWIPGVAGNERMTPTNRRLSAPTLSRLFLLPNPFASQLLNIRSFLYSKLVPDRGKLADEIHKQNPKSPPIQVSSIMHMHNRWYWPTIGNGAVKNHVFACIYAWFTFGCVQIPQALSQTQLSHPHNSPNKIRPPEQQCHLSSNCFMSGTDRVRTRLFGYSTPRLRK